MRDSDEPTLASYLRARVKAQPAVFSDNASRDGAGDRIDVFDPSTGEPITELLGAGRR